MELFPPNFKASIKVVRLATLAAAETFGDQVSDVLNDVLSHTWHHLKVSVLSRVLTLELIGSLSPISPLYLEQPCDKVVLDHVVVPERDEYGNKADEHTLHSSNIRYPVKGSVP